MKKTFCLVLAAMLLVSLSVFGAFAEEDGKDRTISVNKETVQMENNDFLVEEIVIEIHDEANQGKDWVGVYPEATVDLNAVSMDDTIGWWAYVSGETMVLNAANFKAEWSKYEFQPGESYYVALFDNDGYQVLDYVIITIAEPPTPVPTDTPEPTATPEPTEVPTDAPTAAPTAEPTEAPTDEPAGKSGCGSTAASVSAVLVLLSGACLLRKKRG